MKLDVDKRNLYIERSKKLSVYDLNHYILRKSKTTDYNSLVLEATSEKTSEKGQQLHLGFKDVKIFRQWYELLKRLVEYIIWERIKNMLYPP